MTAGDCIQLTEAEERICAWVGQQRYAHALATRRAAGLGPSAAWDGPALHIRGAKTEFAASVILNLSWRPTIGSIRDRDIGGLIEVRSTDLPHGRLIVKPQKPDDDDGAVPYVLTLISGNVFRLCGWMFAGVARRWPLLTGFGDPAHFVPQGALYLNAALREWIINHERCCAIRADAYEIDDRAVGQFRLAI